MESTIILNSHDTLAIICHKLYKKSLKCKIHTKMPLTELHRALKLELWTATNHSLTSPNLLDWGKAPKYRKFNDLGLYKKTPMYTKYILMTIINLKENKSLGK